MLIDTHCHLNSQELRLDARALIIRARDWGIEKMVIVGTDYEDSCEAVAMTQDFSQFGLYASVGIHPHEAKRYDKIPDEFRSLIKDEKVVAIGEIGLDYHYDHSPREAQIKMFETQLDFASEVNMPVILHIREAMPDAMNILRSYKGLKMLFHCYSGGFEYIEEVLELRGMCSFGGALTWNSSTAETLREVFKKIPIENILLETDCPYMAPVPFRGKVNEPSYVRYVYERAAHEKNMALDDLAQQIEKNSQRFFNW